MKDALSLFFAGALLASSTGVIANDLIRPSAEQESSDPGFASFDANQDGFISESEAIYYGLSEKKFTVWDSNGDDMLSEAEYLKGVKENNNVDHDIYNY